MNEVWLVINQDSRQVRVLSMLVVYRMYRWCINSNGSVYSGSDSCIDTMVYLIVDMTLPLYLCIINVYAMNIFYLCTLSSALYWVTVYATRWRCGCFWIMYTCYENTWYMHVHKIEWYSVMVVWSLVGVILELTHSCWLYYSLF